MPDRTPYRYSDQVLRYLREAPPEDEETVRATIAMINAGDERLPSFPSPFHPGVEVALMTNGHVLAWRVHAEFRMLYEVLYVGLGGL